ncbi:MAG: ATP-binding cassette domain-containing protein [Gammaproteobacteria bacterium]
MNVKRRWFVPEVVQTSAMDCGPATLKSILEGYGVPVSYGRLREACQTDVDGTSIDMIEEVANLLGLDAEQVMLPFDHLLLNKPESLPAIVVTQRKSGETHFVVAWRCFGPFVQIMDPALGRRWLTRESFLSEVYQHRLAVPAEDWREWAGSEEFLYGLEARIAAVADSATEITGWALRDPSWYSLAALDGAVRMVETLSRNGGIKRGSEGREMLRTLYQSTARDFRAKDCVPEDYWQVAPLSDRLDSAELLLKGAVVVCIRGLSDSGPATDLPPDLEGALAEEPDNPWKLLKPLLKDIGVITPLILATTLLWGSAVLLIEALLFRGLMDLMNDFDNSGQRLVGTLIVALLALILMLLEYANAREWLRLGRQLEIRIRTAFLRKVPLLTDRYFNSRPVSDMAERAHVVQHLRNLPRWSAQILRCCVELLMTTAGIIWLDPAVAPWAVLTALTALGIPILVQPALNERDLRARIQNGASSRFFLESLLGLTAVRAHCAERTVRARHEALLSECARARVQELRVALRAECLQGILCTGLVIGLLVRHYDRVGASGGFLLLVFWAMKLPALGQQLSALFRQYAPQRNVALRVIEPLGAREEDKTPNEPAQDPRAPEPASRNGVTIDFRALDVHVAGHPILQDVDLSVTGGSHVAIVGASGAGKSSLVGLLLGWISPASGEIRIDGKLLDAVRLEKLRLETAWLEPTVQLWNRSLLDNLLYGAEPNALTGIGKSLEFADLHEVLQSLPDGLQTSLGEGGAFLSSGQAQRVRLGRVLLRRNARLVILDEPFKGLERGQREAYLSRLRTQWADATLFCVTHDISAALGFDRVLVMDGGRIVEDAAPTELAKLPDSRFQTLLTAENRALQSIWADRDWRNICLDGGRIRGD